MKFRQHLRAKKPALQNFLTFNKRLIESGMMAYHIKPYFLLLKSYLTNRQFYLQQKNENSPLLFIKAGVPQGSVLVPVLYTL